MIWNEFDLKIMFKWVEIQLRDVKFRTGDYWPVVQKQVGLRLLVHINFESNLISWHT